MDGRQDGFWKQVCDEGWESENWRGKKISVITVILYPNFQVLIDPDVENLLVFKTSSNFHEYWMVKEKYLILQDKV